MRKDMVEDGVELIDFEGKGVSRLQRLVSLDLPCWGMK